MLPSLPKSTPCNSSQALVLKSWTSSAQEFLVGLNPEALQAKYTGVLTATSALGATDVTLSHIEEAYGQNVHILFIKANLVKLQDFLNVKDEMLLDSAILTEVSTYIYEEFSTLTLAEFALVIRQIKKGYFGIIYARIDPLFVQECFRRYQDEQRVGAMVKVAKEEVFQVQFTPPYYQWAKKRLSKEFPTLPQLMDHLVDYRRYLCQHCRARKLGDCKQAAAELVEKETVNTYAIATWLLCWSSNLDNKLKPFKYEQAGSSSGVDKDGRA